MPAQFSVFLHLSRVLTGKNTLELDLAEAYFERMQTHLGPKLHSLLTRFAELLDQGKDPIEVVAKEIFPNSAEGPSAKLILLLWYTGGVQVPPDNDWEMQSADHYYRALVWEAIGAHAPTRSNGYFGHWKYPPQQ